MKVLVVGGAGLIGIKIMNRLAEMNHEVCCVDINPCSPNLDDIRKKIKVSRGDATIMADIIRPMLEFRPDRVIHLAFILDEPSGESNPHQAVRLNILSLDNCFEAARLCGVKNVVFASSIGVYGAQSLHGERALSEDDPCLGTSLYRVSKIYNENQAIWYNRAYGMQIVGIRAANVTGPDKVHGSMDHVNCMVLPAKGIPVRLPHRDAMRLLINAEDTAEAFVRIALTDSPKHTIYNTGGVTTNMGQLANIVRQYLPDADISFEKEEGGKSISGNYLSDNTRITEEFGTTLTPLSQLVKEIINSARIKEGLPIIS